MKPFFILAIALFNFSSFSADRQNSLEKKQYMYLISQPLQPDSDGLKYLSFLMVNPHLIYKYLKLNNCPAYGENIQYYKISAATIKKVLPKDSLKRFDWNTYQEDKKLNSAQKKHLSSNSDSNFKCSHSDSDFRKILFDPFGQIIMRGSFKLAGHHLRSWRTGKKIKSSSY